MNNRDWIHTVSPEERERRNALMKEHLERSMRQMDEETEELCKKLRMTTGARQAAEAAWRRVALYGRRSFLLPRHTAVERKFLRMMIKILIAENPGLASRSLELARYLSDNYPFEWTISPSTAIARAQARHILLTEAESEFGETPIARPFAYSLYHWRQLRIKDPANLGEVYAMAVFLDHQRHFMDKDPERRKDLGLHRHALRRQLRTREARQATEKTSPQPGVENAGPATGE
jgi:hypothetical protein